MRIHPYCITGIKALSALLCAFFSITTNAYADSPWEGSSSTQQERPDAHAPIGVMGDHTHAEDEFMLSYRYMFMEMEGNRSGTRGVSEAEVLSQYMVAPTEMEMKMHMLGAMYAPSDTLTLMAMLPYVELSMNHVTRMGMAFTTESTGIGDIQLAGLWNILEDTHHRVHLNTGISLPTGEIDERGNTPAGQNMKLPYPMQLGSGTFDLRPGVTYAGQTSAVSWGAQVMGTIRLGENDNNYTLGDRIDGTLWGAIPVSDWLSGSLRLAWQSWGDIDGRDADLNPMMVATADPNLRGGERYDLGVGFNVIIPEGMADGLRIAAEALYPLEQQLDGPQLETDISYVIGAQMLF